MSIRMLESLSGLPLPLDPMTLTLSLPLLLFAYYWLFQPSAFLYLHDWYWRTQLGFQIRECHCGAFTFCYSELGRRAGGGDGGGGATGTRPSLLFLHAFSANKDMWLPLLRFLPRDRHVVCVDMPGHEGTTRAHGDDYSLQGQVIRIKQFVAAVGLDAAPFHLLGTSMGGGVAGVYAATHPGDVHTLTLICPAGLDAPTESRFVGELRAAEAAGDFTGVSLIPRSPAQVARMLQLVTYSFKLPQQILQAMVDVRRDHNDFYLQLLTAITAERSRFRLHETMHLITAPTLVVWGKQDQVLDVSGAVLLSAVLPRCRVELLDDCGHTVTMERPHETARLLLAFLAHTESGG
ncbi:monoacylglycerol lipase abhd6-A-like [Lethenteron reissneri]|uniref:monoacylglycerol lipase abhd6-A-like n=2 Tax=Lethenteron reissneri TaxID=7753 RepID=UPI002AB6F5A8|nr:monoacylglycerol lipase abhd6-A-like [Lethenteron reissneri]